MVKKRQRRSTATPYNSLMPVAALGWAVVASLGVAEASIMTVGMEDSRLGLSNKWKPVVYIVCQLGWGFLLRLFVHGPIKFRF